MTKKRMWDILTFIFLLLFLICLSYIIYFRIGIKEDRNILKNSSYITQEEINEYYEKVKKSHLVPTDSFNSKIKVSDKYGTGDIDIVKNTHLIGDVVIPKLNVSEQLRLGDSPIILKYSLGLVRGSELPDKKLGTSSLIAGHRGYAGISDYFLHIDKLNKGDEIIINKEHESLVYHVTKSYVIKPNERWKVSDYKNKSIITLVTCTPLFVWSDRLMVEAEYVKTIKK